MFLFASWIILVMTLCIMGIPSGSSYSGLDACIIIRDSDSDFYTNQFCMVNKNDMNLACPEDKKIVLVSVHFPLKSSINACTKRILNSRNSYCCNVHNKDLIYNGRCLQQFWNSEDSHHYRQFMMTALKQCNNLETCVLEEEMFINLQREIPQTRKFSSYIQLNHQCITVPSGVVDMCSARSLMGKEIHIQDRLVSKEAVTESCTCHVNSDGNGKVIVKAVDVRTANSGLILQTNDRTYNFSHNQQPLFGFEDMITQQEFDITILKGPDKKDDNMWLQLTGSNGQDVSIICEGPQHTTTKGATEATTLPMTTSPLPDRETPAVQEIVAEQQDDFLEEYWPMIYLGAGSGITIVLVVCVVGSILICRYSMMKETERKGQYGNPYRHSQVNYNRSGRYDTVLDDMQHIPGHMVASNHETLEWR